MIGQAGVKGSHKGGEVKVEDREKEKIRLFGKEGVKCAFTEKIRE